MSSSPAPSDRHDDVAATTEPPIGSVWELRYRVLGPSAVWPGLYVCELLSGPDKGEKVVLDGDQFSGERTPQGRYISALAPARGRAGDAA